MTDTMISQNTELSSWDTLYIGMFFLSERPIRECNSKHTQTRTTTYCALIRTSELSAVRDLIVSFLPSVTLENGFIFK
jgi:hypothetical protein